MGKLKPQTVAYEYYFEYYEEGKYNEKTVCGASVTIAIKAYKHDNIIIMPKDPMYRGYFLSDILNVSFDKEKQLCIEKNRFMESVFRNALGVDSFTYQIIGYSLDTVEEVPEEGKNNPNYKTLFPTVKTNPVSEIEFKSFIYENRDGFDIKSNKKASVLKALMVSLEKE